MFIQYSEVQGLRGLGAQGLIGSGVQGFRGSVRGRLPEVPVLIAPSLSLSMSPCSQLNSI